MALLVVIPPPRDRSCGHAAEGFAFLFSPSAGWHTMPGPNSVLKNVSTRHFEERSDEKSLFFAAFLKRDFSLRSK
jgi:hypothetical protein